MDSEKVIEEKQPKSGAPKVKDKLEEILLKLDAIDKRLKVIENLPLGINDKPVRQLKESDIIHV